jgi:mannose-6-phosphate isomerase
MVIPEKITPSGVVLPDQKLHGGLGFDLMFDCFVYDGYNEEETRNRYFIKPKKISETQMTLADNTITDRFRFDSFHVKESINIDCGSYGIILVIEGQGVFNGISLCKGDRVFIPEYEKQLAVESKDVTFLLCRPPL